MEIFRDLVFMLIFFGIINYGGRITKSLDKFFNDYLKIEQQKDKDNGKD
jgi:hypothetical protein